MKTLFSEEETLRVFGEGGPALLSLVEIVDLSWRGPYGWSVLHYLADQGSEDAIRRVLDRGMSVNGGEGEAAVSVAARAGHEGAVRLLVERGAEVGDEVLLSAVKGAPKEELSGLKEGSRLGLVTFLLGQGCNVNARDAKGNSVLFLAMGMAELSVVRLLLEKGADVDARSEAVFGFTPLHSAVVHAESWKKFGLLLYYGASVEAKDEYGHTVWQALCAGKDKMR